MIGFQIKPKTKKKNNVLNVVNSIKITATTAHYNAQTKA
jgi:hypothetical protein